MQVVKQIYFEDNHLNLLWITEFYVNLRLYIVLTSLN